MNSNKEIITAEELLISNMHTIEALFRVLEKKGIVTQEEVLEEIKVLEAERRKKHN